MNTLAAFIILLISAAIKANDLKKLFYEPRKRGIKCYLYFLRSSLLFLSVLHLGLQAFIPELPFWSSMIMFPIIVVAYDAEYRGMMKSTEPPRP